MHHELLSGFIYMAIKIPGPTRQMLGRYTENEEDAGNTHDMLPNTKLHRGYNICMKMKNAIFHHPCKKYNPRGSPET